MWPKIKSCLGWVWTPSLFRARAWQRWAWRAGVLLILLILSIPVILIPIAESIICSRLKAAVADRANARLEIDGLHYLPPFGATLDGIRLINNGPDANPMKLLEIPELHLKLAGLPHGSLDIESLELDQLALHTVRLPSGKLWTPSVHDLIRTPQSTSSAPPSEAPSAGGGFHIGHFAMPDAKLLLNNGDTTSDLADISIDTGPAGIDNGVLTIGQSHLTARSGEASDIGGSLKFDGSATLPLHDMTAARFDGALSATGISTPANGIVAKLNLAMSAHGADGRAAIHLDHLDASGGGATFVVSNQPTMAFDFAAHRWTTGQLIAHADPGKDPSQLPSGLREKLEQWNIKAAFSVLASASGSLPTKPPATTSDYLSLIDPRSQLVIDRDGDLTLQPSDWPHLVKIESSNRHLIVFDRDGVHIPNLVASYGVDELTIDSATIPLADLFQKEIYTDLKTQVTLDTFAPKYPPVLDAAFGHTPPDGSISLTLEGLRLAPSHLSCRTGQIALGDGTIEVDSIDASLSETPGRSGKCDLTVTTMNLKQVRKIFHYPDPQGKIAGIVSGNIHVEFHPIQPGEPSIDAIDAEGTIQVDNGDFFDMPMFGQIADQTGVPLDRAGRVGQAAAIFTLHNGILHFSKLAVNSPALGIAGEGDINLIDQTLDLTLVAQVLGDWQAKAGGIPVIGQVLGTVQNGLNQLSAKYLYNYHVGGTFDKPDPQPRILPGLNANQANLFGAMQNLGATGGHLLENLKGQQGDQDQPQK